MTFVKGKFIKRSNAERETNVRLWMLAIGPAMMTKLLACCDQHIIPLDLHLHVATPDDHGGCT